MSFRLSDARILLIFALGFILCAIALSFASRQALDPNDGKNWWVASFVDPSGTDLDFVIENHSDSPHFTYRITEDGIVVTNDAVDIPVGQSKTIHVSQSAEIRKTTIDVQTSDKDKKEIYKNTL